MFVKKTFKFLFTEDLIGYEAAIIIEAVACKRSRCILCLFRCFNFMYRYRRSVPLCNLLQDGSVLIGVRALVGIIENHSFFINTSTLDTALELRNRGAVREGQIIEQKVRLCLICNLKALVNQELGV